MREEIIDYIRRNRVSTTEVADALGKKGEFSSVQPLATGQFRVGAVHWAYAYDGSNWPLHEQLQEVPENCVVVVSAMDCEGRAVFGDLVSKYLILYRQVAAIAVDGLMRDVPRIIKEAWPVWCSGRTPIGCVNRKPDGPPDRTLVDQLHTRYHGAVAVCDDCGVVIVEKDHHNQDFIDRLHFIENQEDVWYDCIDRRKWNTFDTVCLKRYQDDSSDEPS